MNWHNDIDYPIVGRMLNPDNFVQVEPKAKSRFIGNATSTQAYNRYSYVVNNPLKYTDPSGWLRNYITHDDILGHQSLMEGLAQVQAGMEWMMGSRRGLGGSFTYTLAWRSYVSAEDQKAADESWTGYGIALSPPFTTEVYFQPHYQPSGVQFTQPFAMGMANVVAPTGDMAAMGGGTPPPSKKSLEQLKKEYDIKSNIGNIIFEGFTKEKLAELFRVIPEDIEDDTYTPQKNGIYYGDGFFWKYWTPEKYWYKVSKGGTVYVVFNPDKLTFYTYGWVNPAKKKNAELAGKDYFVGWHKKGGFKRTTPFP
ncbi:MAG: hypothetical protein K1X55_16090 [Chitinophagales bacterium]|nr:hypothetical protein [Chitinophagales bacterium]